MRFLGKKRRGSAGIEGMLALPAMLVLFGAVAQVMITGQSRVHLEQAAYAAARSALVFKCPDFDLIDELRSSVAQLATQPECRVRRSELNRIAQARAEDAARWALIAAAPTQASQRPCPGVPDAAREILAWGGDLQNFDPAIANAICYVYEPENVTVDLEWVRPLGWRSLRDGEVPLRATVTFRYPLSTPFRRFILNDGGGERSDGTYYRTGTATVTLL